MKTIEIQECKKCQRGYGIGNINKRVKVKFEVCSENLDIYNTSLFRNLTPCSLIGKHALLDGENRPHQFTNAPGKERILWVNVQTHEAWYGWRVKMIEKGFWKIVNSAYKADYVSESPESKHGNHLGFTNIKIDEYIKLIARVFSCFQGEYTEIDPVRMAINVAQHPICTSEGNDNSEFGIFPTPLNKWGWMYMTASGRILAWTAENILYCIGMEESVNFRQDLIWELGRDMEEISGPDWLDNSIKSFRNVIRIDLDNFESWDGVPFPEEDALSIDPEFFKKVKTKPTIPKRNKCTCE